MSGPLSEALAIYRTERAGDCWLTGKVGLPRHVSPDAERESRKPSRAPIIAYGPRFTGKSSPFGL
jgi:hypothetical protein